MNIVKTYFPPVPKDQGSHGSFLLAVLTQDEQDLYASYIGIVKISDPTDVDEGRKRAEWVASGGEKLGWQRSRAYFDVPEAMYRR